MKNLLKIFLAIIITGCFAMPGFCITKNNTLNVDNRTINGKFEAVTSGFIVINKNGVRQSFTRVQNPSDIYTDLITYRTSPFSLKTTTVPCRVDFVDTWLIKIKTPNSEAIEIPRYRVVNLEINIK